MSLEGDLALLKGDDKFLLRGEPVRSNVIWLLRVGSLEFKMSKEDLGRPFV